MSIELTMFIGPGTPICESTAAAPRKKQVRLEQLERLRSEIPPPPHDYPYYIVIHIRCLVKIRQSQSYKFEKIAKNSNFEILQEPLSATHLLKLPDKMYKYETDRTRTVGATERTRDAGRTDGRTDGRSETNIPPTTSLCGGLIILLYRSHLQQMII